jgi:hypothetical protein
MSSHVFGAYKTIKLIKSERVQQLIEERYLTDADLQMTVHHGETTGEKLYQEGTDRFLARSKYVPIIYVEYSPYGDAYEVHTAYGHRSKII